MNYLSKKADAGGGKAAQEAPAERLLRLIQWSSAAGRQLRRHLAEVAAECDLTDSDLLVVWLCRGTGRVQFELASSIGVSPAQMSGIVERLGSQGLIAMHRPMVDRRRQIWRTSASGLALLERLAPRLEELAAALDGSVSSDEQRAAEDLCIRLAESAGGGRGSTPGGASPDNQDGQRVCKEAA